MSWFDAAGLASIAKSALKEAQRTIDKALDIREDDAAVPANTPIDIDGEDFFGAWGISQSGNIQKEPTSTDTAPRSPSKSNKMSASLWGSFTGSFFETANKPRGSVESLDDSVDLGDEGFSSSKLVVQQSDDGESVFSRMSSVSNECEEEKEMKVETSNLLDANIGNDTSNTLTPQVKKIENRLSVISISSGKSSESVEIVNSGTGCTTSPDTEQSVQSTPTSSLKASESVEVLQDSPTSPSSVEILPESETQSYSQEEFVSPLQSPLEDISLMPTEKMSPDSVEIIADNSLDESVSFVSIESFGKKDEPITKGPSRSLHLQLTPALIDSIEKDSNVIDIPQEVDDEGSQSDRTMIASDTVMESSSDTSTTNESNTNSYYVKNMLADAMTEKSLKLDQNQLLNLLPNLPTIKDTQLANITVQQTDLPPRETSPLSSESRSDLVKIGSDQTSGHTSGDENETATSSDIEIISSPNGDSSSTQSRHSPAKTTIVKSKGDANIDSLLGKMTFQKIKGHNRELSEASSVSDDSHSEVDRLLKRISEITEILELRETKLIEFNRQNAELQEINNNLQSQLDVVLTKQIESVELSQVTEEYTQRLSSLEKKFQQAIREKDILRKQLDQSKQEAAGRMSKTEMDSILNEKDEVIKELREEGEKLSKQQLQHSNIIKKLRTKEKEHEATIKHLKENVESLTSETERLKRSLVAKEDVERTQIEAVHQLTTKNKKSEYEISHLQGQLDDVSQKYDTVKKSLDAAKKELIDKNKTSSALQAREIMLQSLENEKRMTESQNEEIVNQLEDLRFKLSQADQEYVRKEQLLRSENAELMRRLEEIERRNEELTQSVMEVSRPLVRQLESLQATHNMKLATFEKVEQSMLLKISDMQSKYQVASDAERLTREECLNMRSKLSSLETQMNTTAHQNEILKMEIEQQKTEKIINEQELKRETEQLKEQLKQQSENAEAWKKDLHALEQQLSIEKAATEAEKRKSVTLQEQLREKQEPFSSLARASPTTTRNTSPTLSVGRVSLSESLGSNVWPPDEPFDMNPPLRYTNMLELQMLQTNLKQREGEVQQLQWELNRREQEKNLLSTEISKLLTKVDNLEKISKQFEHLQGQFLALQQQYDTLCQLYGEKVEEAEELKLDLVDVKELYKTQLDELLNQQKSGK